MVSRTRPAETTKTWKADKTIYMEVGNAGAVEIVQWQPTRTLGASAK